MRLAYKYQQEFQTLSHQEFACAANAMNAANQLAKTMKWHQLSAVDIVEKAHHDKSGSTTTQGFFGDFWRNYS